MYLKCIRKNYLSRELTREPSREKPSAALLAEDFMLTQTPDAQLLTLSKYDRIVVYLFRDLTQGLTAAKLPSELPFDQIDVRAAMRRAVSDEIIDREVANVPDVKYTYDTRRELPSEVEQAGPMTWLQTGK